MPDVLTKIEHMLTELGMPQQELIVRIVTHESIDKLHLASRSFEFLHQQHLMHIVASQAIRGSDDHPIESRATNLIAQPIQSRSP